MSGRVTDSVPSFGVLAASTVGYVWPPSVDRLIFTFAVRIGAADVPATSQVIVCAEAPAHDRAVFGAVTRNGPVAGVRSSVVSPLFTPPRGSRAVRRMCSDSGAAFVPAKPT